MQLVSKQYGAFTQPDPRVNITCNPGSHTCYIVMLMQGTLRVAEGNLTRVEEENYMSPFRLFMMDY